MTTQLLTDDVNAVQYGVMLNGKVVFKSANRILAENYMANLSENERAAASILPLTTTGKQILFG